MTKPIKIINNSFFNYLNNNTSILTITLDKEIDGFLDNIELPINKENIILQRRTKNQIILEIKNKTKN